MKTSIIEPRAAYEILAMAEGEYIWASRTGQDAIVRLDLGSPHLHVQEPSPRAAAFTGSARTALGKRVVMPVGQWHLFVESGLWRVTALGIECDRTDAEVDVPQKVAQVTRCLSLLDGQRLTSTCQNGAGGEWRFAFDLGGELSIKADTVAAAAAEAVWTLFLKDGTNLSSMSDGTFVLEEAAFVPQ